jgi:hypothetical protein
MSSDPPDYLTAVERALKSGADLTQMKWVDWLVEGLNFPFDCVYKPLPPCTLQEVAEAWYRKEPSDSVEEWLESIEWEVYGDDSHY